MDDLKSILDSLWAVGTQLDNFITNTDFNEITDGDEALYMLQKALRTIDESATDIIDVLRDSYDVEM